MLSIGAAMLGALHVVGVDVDDDALRVARQNVDEYEDPLPVREEGVFLLSFLFLFFMHREAVARQNVEEHEDPLPVRLDLFLLCFLIYTKGVERQDVEEYEDPLPVRVGPALGCVFFPMHL